MCNLMHIGLIAMVSIYQQHRTKRIATMRMRLSGLRASIGGFKGPRGHGPQDAKFAFFV